MAKKHPQHSELAEQGLAALKRAVKKAIARQKQTEAKLAREARSGRKNKSVP